MNEREQIINFLLQACDAKNRVIEELQRANAELRKALEAEKSLLSVPPAEKVTA